MHLNTEAFFAFKEKIQIESTYYSAQKKPSISN